MLYLAAAAAATFNLICSGMTEKTDVNGSHSEPYSVIYRVDLAARLWCSGDDQECKTPEKLADFNAVIIKFADTTTDTPEEYFRYVEQVDRETGRHQSLIISGRAPSTRITKQEGRCRSSAFTGFPKAVTKF